MRWIPSLGARPVDGGVEFRVWAPAAALVEVVPEQPGQPAARLARTGDGYFAGRLGFLRPGDLYRYRVDGRGPYPDPASRYQPRGVHGPSQVVDPEAFRWTDAAWKGRELASLVFYELHVGTFTPEGTFAAAQRRLPYLRDLGVTAVELMPVSDFTGNRNWGYDSAALFAPARCYGAPDDLRTLVDEAHRLGLAVYLDVVYNHFGPDGAYAPLFSRRYLSPRHRSPWGAGVNLAGEGSGPVRRFFIENALHWIHEYHFDGLRLDATHAIPGGGPQPFLAELSAAVRQSLEGSARQVHLIAEDHRNLARLVKPPSDGGWGLDAVWADDFHHQIRRHLAGDSDGYFEDFRGTTEDIAATLRHGWFFRGQHSVHFGGPRGTDPAGIPPHRFVICIQNHDQVGNRAVGDRLHHTIELAAYRAASALLLLAPQTPLLFMGQEWAASTPFLFFTDHRAELGRRIRRGRWREFRRFRAFAGATARRRLPDPQLRATFAASRLHWPELESEPHASTLSFYRRLLQFRRREPALAAGSAFRVEAAGRHTIVLRRDAAGSSILVVARLSGAGPTSLAGHALARTDAGSWKLALSSEDAAFTPHPVPLEISFPGPVIRFHRPGAVIFRSSSGQEAP